MPTKATSSESVIGPLLADALANIEGIKQKERAIADNQNAVLRVSGTSIHPWDLPDEDLWVDGIAPPTFTEFVCGKEFMNGMLFPRQRAAIVDSIGDSPREIFYPRQRLAAYQDEVRKGGSIADVISTIILCWGKGCKIGSDRLTDAVTHETRTMREWADKGCPLHLPSWDGEKVVIAESSPVYLKGEAPLYRVMLDDGRTVTVTGRHRFLGVDGWRELDELVVGEKILAIPLVNDERKGANDHQQTEQDSLSAQSSPPLRGDALAYIHNSRKGAADDESQHNPNDRLCDRSLEETSPPVDHADASPDQKRADGVASFRAESDTSLQDRQLSSLIGNPHPQHRDQSGEDRHQPYDSRDDVTPSPLQESANEPSHGTCYIWQQPASASSHQRNLAMQPLHQKEQSHDRVDLPVGCGMSHYACGVRRELDETGDHASLQPPQPSYHSHNLEQNCQCMCRSDLSSISSVPKYRTIVEIIACGTDEFFDLSVPEHECYFDTDGILNHNSGKDYLIAYILSYICYVICSMRNPWAYFTLGYAEPFDMINVAVNADQARRIFFTKVTNNLSKDCFKKFGRNETGPEIGRDVITFYRDLYGYSLPVPMLRLHSKHSEARSYEGMNVLCFTMDECSAFSLKGSTIADISSSDDDEYIPSPADEIYATLRTSASTRFPSQFLGFLISFPRSSENDFTLRLYDMSQETGPDGHRLFPYLWGDRAATWEVNVTKVREDFQADFDENPEDAEMKLACNPPPVRGGFFSLTEKIDASFSRDDVPAIRASETITDNGMAKFVALAIDELHLSRAHTYVAHFDPGLSADAFAFVLAHPNWTKHERVRDEEDKEYLVPEVVIDACLLWRPDKRLRQSVDYLNVSEIILRVARSCHLAAATADRWNSEHLKQSLQKARVTVEYDAYTRSQQLALYRNLKAVMYRGMLKIRGHYADYPALARMKGELTRLQLINGAKIDHPKGGSKDLADALASAVWLACQPHIGRQAFGEYIDSTEDTMIQSYEYLSEREKQLVAAPSMRDLIRSRRI